MMKRDKSKNSFRQKPFLKTLIVIICFLLLPFCIYGEEEISYEDYNGKRIGVLVGPLMESVAKEYFPDSEYLLLNSYTDCITALLTNKIDGYLCDEPEAKTVHSQQKEIDYIHKRITENNYAFAFRKDDPEALKLCNEFNEFLEQCHGDGTMKELEDIWFSDDETKKHIDMSDLNGERLIRVATTSSDAPYSYIKDGKSAGYDIDLIVRFCRKQNYALEISDMDFSARIPAIESGKCDFTTDMNVTPERKKQVLFSNPTSKGGIVLAVRSSDLNPQNSSNSVYKTIDDLDGKIIGVVTGSVHDKLVEERLKNSDIRYYNSFTDLSAALKTGQIDSFVCPKSIVTFMAYEDEKLMWLNEYLSDVKLGFAFNKSDEGKRLNEKFSEYIRTLDRSGRLEELKTKWFDSDEEIKTLMDYESLPDDNGTLIMACESDQFPYNYIRDEKIVGYEIEIAALFCKEYGYKLQLEKMNFDGILMAVQTGKVDFAASCLAITDERKESVDFSESHYTENVVFVVLNEDLKNDGSFLSGIYDSFHKTFIKESRYKLFLEGIATTLLITILAIVFGTIIGYIVFMMCRNGNVLANTISRFCFWLIQGTPMVVLLMVLYYIVFGSIYISGILVAIIGFSITFGSAVFGLLKIGVGAIDKGQYEAAYALGHNNYQTFNRIIFPQAIPHILPAYKGEIVSLIKATAVVGYIAVADLTKMSDVVRSRTYEAFFPLIAVTIIYFILEALFNFVIGRISIVFDYKKRKPENILKGVKIHD